MKKFVPLLALSVTACAPATLDRDLKDIPGLVLHAPYGSRNTGYESAVLRYDSDTGSPCYRIPAETQLTVNGDAFTLEKRGGTREGADGSFSCDYPRFKGPLRPAGEPLTEYVLTDGSSSLRAAFKQLHAARSFRVKVNGTEQTSLRNGSTVDIEWLPVSDRLEGAEVSFEMDGGESAYTYTVAVTSLDANHIRFVLGSMRTGNFTLHVIGRGQAGVEACEGFTTCEADFIEEMQLPIAIE
jgi:hypothetical protein